MSDVDGINRVNKLSPDKSFMDANGHIQTGIANEVNQVNQHLRHKGSENEIKSVKGINGQHQTVVGTNVENIVGLGQNKMIGSSHGLKRTGTLVEEIEPLSKRYKFGRDYGDIGHIENFVRYGDQASIGQRASFLEGKGSYAGEIIKGSSGMGNTFTGINAGEKLVKEGVNHELLQPMIVTAEEQHQNLEIDARQKKANCGPNRGAKLVDHIQLI